MNNIDQIFKMNKCQTEDLCNFEVEAPNVPYQSQCTIEDLPKEIVLMIFTLYVESEGVKKLLTCLAKVSKAWKDIAMDCSLWRTVDDPNLSLRVILSLKQVLSRTRKLNLSHLETPAKHMRSILTNCPKLEFLDVQLKGPQDRTLLQQLPGFCPALETLKLHAFDLGNNKLSPVLTVCGSNLKHLDLSECSISKFQSTVIKIAESCPSLEELHLCHVSGDSMTFPIEIFQRSCLKLRVLQLEEVEFSRNSILGPGFPELEAFGCGVVHCNGPNDDELIRILHKSSKLKVLYLRGNSAVTFVAFTILPCLYLETLDLSRSRIANSSLQCVIARWKHSLKGLDLSMVTKESVLNETLMELIKGERNNLLEELNLSATPISQRMLKTILEQCLKLRFLNLGSCRSLIRGIKRVYYTAKEIDELRKKLNSFTQDYPVVDLESN